MDCAKLIVPNRRTNVGSKLQLCFVMVSWPAACLYITSTGTPDEYLLLTSRSTSGVLVGLDK